MSDQFIEGIYVNCDTAYHVDCYDVSQWPGFESWPEPMPVSRFEESDTPTHCAGCGGLIEHGLTSDGYAYVLDALEAFILDGNGTAAVLRQWWEAYGDGLDEGQLRELASAGVAAALKAPDRGKAPAFPYPHALAAHVHEYWQWVEEHNPELAEDEDEDTLTLEEYDEARAEWEQGITEDAEEYIKSLPTDTTCPRCGTVFGGVVVAVDPCSECRKVNEASVVSWLGPGPGLVPNDPDDEVKGPYKVIDDDGGARQGDDPREPANPDADYEEGLR